MWSNSQDGSCLLELLIVMAIIGMLSWIFAISFSGFVTKAEMRVCDTNCLQLERMYRLHLTMIEEDHSETAFGEYLREYGELPCPSGGEVHYKDGKIWCDGHHAKETDEEDSETCIDNCRAFTESYLLYLARESKQHSDAEFFEYMGAYGQICPAGGVIGYRAGQAWCNLHSLDPGRGEDDGGGDIPFL